MRAYWKPVLLVAIAVAVQWLIAGDVTWLDDARLTVRIAWVRYRGGTGDEPEIERAAHDLVRRQWQRQLAAMPWEQRERVEEFYAAATATEHEEHELLRECEASAGDLQCNSLRHGAW